MKDTVNVYFQTECIIEEISAVINQQVKERPNIPTERFILENGRMGLGRGKGSCNIQMEIPTKDFFKMTLNTEKEDLKIITARSMRATGNLEKRMGSAFNTTATELIMKENGKRTGERGKGYFSWAKKFCMRANGRIMRTRDKESFIWKGSAYTTDSFRRILCMG